MTTRKELLREYAALKGRLERLLYDYDPDGMGSTVSAPLDEYSDVAAALIRALRDRQPEASFSETVWDVVPAATAELLGEIEAAWKASSMTGKE
jgi:hypothetical protein